MTFNELQAILENKKAAIVHFSHHAKTREGVVFPNDLVNAIANRSNWTHCCIALWPNHPMDLVGSVGVLFEPTSTDQIISVCDDDAGSSLDADGNSQSFGKPLSVEVVEQSFLCMPDSYNEWILKGANVRGIFVADPNCIYVKKAMVMDYPDMPEYLRSLEPEIGMTEISLLEVFDSFPDQPIFTMRANGLVEIPRP